MNLLLIWYTSSIDLKLLSDRVLKVGKSLTVSFHNNIILKFHWYPVVGKK